MSWDEYLVLALDESWSWKTESKAILGYTVQVSLKIDNTDDPSTPSSFLLSLISCVSFLLSFPTLSYTYELLHVLHSQSPFLGMCSVCVHWHVCEHEYIYVSADGSWRSTLAVEALQFLSILFSLRKGLVINLTLPIRLDWLPSKCQVTPCLCH